MTRYSRVSFAFLCVVLAAVVSAEEPMPSLEQLHERAVANWPAPLLWAPHSSEAGVREKSATPTSPLTFIGISPCRLADTRDSTKPPGYGPPALSAGVARNFTVTGQCGIPPEAAAVSLNLTVVNTLGVGYILIFPRGGPFAPVSTLNYVAGQTVANAAIVPVGNLGGVTLDAGVSGTDLIIDVNGYYANDLTSQNGQFALTSDVSGGSSGAGVLVVHNTDASGANSWAGQFTTDSCNAGAAGVFGIATNAGCGSAVYGLWGRSLGILNGSSGVYGENPAGGTSHTFGVKGWSNSTGDDQAGVKGIGGYGDPLGDDGDCGPCYPAGVRGVNSNGTTTQAFGVLGISERYGTGGVVMDIGLATQAYGYLGYFDGGTNYYGVFSIGDFGGTGAKYFVEPHPTDASKVIRYVALEGPEAGTYFRGTTEARGGTAVIEVPESFRLVTEAEGLTVQLTPIGEFANLVVVSEDLNRIVVQSSKDVRFHYQINGVRHGYADYEAVTTSPVFAPMKAGGHMPVGLTDAEKRSLISNGTYNADGTINLETAKAQGWDQKWQVPPR